MNATLAAESKVDLPPDYGDWQPYRSISRGAIISLSLAVFSLLGFAFPSLLGFAVVGIVVGALAVRNIRKHPLEYTGEKIALLGVWGSGLLLLAGISFHVVIYLTEVPEGYENNRISFYELQPSPFDKNEVIPQRAVDLNGQKIFVKGYMHPAVQGMGKVKHFVLVPDMGTCCFGGQPKMTDMIEVHLQTERGIQWSPSIRKLAGVFQLAPPRKVDDLTNVCYHLTAEHAQ